ARHARAQPGEGRDPRRRPAGRARRGRARPRARQGGGRHRLRARVRVILRIALALLAAMAAVARAQESGERATLTQLEQRSRAFYELLDRGERERAAGVWPGLEADLARFRTNLEERLGR